MSNQNPDVTSMDQVRDLLMGTQLKDMESRMQRQEERFMREIADLRESMKTRSESLENFMKSESATLLHRIKEEQAERAAAIKNEQRERQESIVAEHRDRSEILKQDRKDTEDALTKLAKDLAAKEEALERKIAALSGTLDTAEQSLRQLMLAENARLSEKVEEKYKEALEALSKTATDLRNDLVSRSSLASLFTEAAMRMAGQQIGPAQEEDENPPKGKNNNGM